MSTTIQRVIPIRGHEIQRRSNDAHALLDKRMQVGEVHSSTDTLGFTRFFCAHRHVGGYLHHGDVATEAAMLALDNPGAAHACFPGDYCRRTDLPGKPMMLCIAGSGSLVTDWAALGRGDGGTAWGLVGGDIADQPDLVAALAGKAAASHTHAQSEVTGLDVALAAKADAAAVALALADKADSADVDALELADTGTGYSLISAAPFGLRKLIAGAGVTLAIVGGAIEISAEGGASGPLVTGTASDTYSGITTGEIATVSTGWGWSASGSSTPYQNPFAADGFTGISTGTITEATTGSGWTSAGTSYVP